MKKFITKKIVNLIDRRVYEILNKSFRRFYLNEIWENETRKGSNRLLKLLSHGLYFYCHTDSVLEKMIYEEAFEKGEILFINAFLKEGDQFIDIGAHSGLHSIYAAKKIGESGNVYSFEPTLKTYKRLIENIELNKFNNITAFNYAVSEKAETMKFYSIEKGYEAWNSLAEPFIGEKYSTVEVNATKINEMDKLNIDFNRSALVKIDIEGFELMALKGGVEQLKQDNSPTLMIEFAREHQENSGSSCAELYEYIEYLGYRLFIYDHKNNTLEKASKSDYYFQNIIATKKELNVIKRIQEN